VIAALARLLARLTGREKAPEPPTAPHAPPAAAPAWPATEDLARILRDLGARDPEGWAIALHGPLHRHGITTPARLAAFLANVLHETAGLARLVESMDYAPSRLLEVFGRHRISEAQAAALGRVPGRAAKQEAIANLVYGGEWGRRHLGNTEPGDGWRFRGRGLIQLTGRANYRRFAEAIEVPLDALPELLETRAGAAESAAHFWEVAGCNGLADRGDLDAVRRRVNGGTLGMAEVRRYAERAMAASRSSIA
jgi:putative chitinase